MIAEPPRGIRERDEEPCDCQSDAFRDPKCEFKLFTACSFGEKKKSLNDVKICRDGSSSDLEGPVVLSPVSQCRNANAL